MSIRLTGIVTAFALFALSACGSEPDAVVHDGPYAADIALAQENATSDFEREALADGVITEDEYDQAHILWLECMEDHFPPGSVHQVGIRKVELSGLYEYTVDGSLSDETSALFDQMYEACSLGTIEHIAYLYHETTFNPERLDLAVLMFQCLERDNLVPPDYTQEDFEADYAAYFDQSPMHQNSPMALLPDHMGVHMCLGTPHHNQ